MERFFVPPSSIDLQTGSIMISGNDVNHIRNVLRKRPGDELWISDGQKAEYHCRLEEYQPGTVLLSILYAQEPDYELPSKITLYQALPKADKMEWIIQKAVELGAWDIIPVRTARCVMRLEGERADKKTSRWQQVSEAAAKQCRRLHVPQIGPVMSWKEALEDGEKKDLLLIPYELSSDMERTRSILSNVSPGQTIGILIGPEGGFEKKEVDDAVKKGAVPITLGHRILRTETAGMALLAALMFRLDS